MLVDSHRHHSDSVAALTTGLSQVFTKPVGSRGVNKNGLLLDSVLIKSRTALRAIVRIAHTLVGLTHFRTRAFIKSVGQLGIDIAPRINHFLVFRNGLG